MELQAKRTQLLDSLSQVRERIGQLNQELQLRLANEQQILGAIMLCDELIAETAVASVTAAASEATAADD